MKKLLKVLILSTFLVSFMSLNVFLVVYLLFFVFHLFNIKNKKTKNHIPKFLILLLVIFICSTFIALIITPNLGNFFKGLLSLIIIFSIIYFIVYYSDDEVDLNEYIKIYLIGMIIMFIMAIIEFITGFHFTDANYFQIYEIGSYEYEVLKKAPTVFLYNPNNIAIVATLSLPLRNIGFKKKYLKILYTILCGLTVLFTGSRGGIIIFCLIILFELFFFKQKEKTFYKFLFLGVICIIIIYFSDLILNQLKYAGFFNTSIEGMLEDSRFYLISKAFELSVRNRFIGVGPLCSSIAMASVLGNEFSIHNFILEILVEFGLIGLVCFLIFYLYLLIKIFKIKNNKNKRNSILLTLIIFIPLSFIPPTIISLYNYWVVIGFALAYIIIERRKNYEKN